MLVAVSCKKNQSAISEIQQDVILEAITQVLRTENLEKKKTLYNLLNSAEKSKIWKDQFEVALAKPEFNQNQRDFITQILATGVPRLFEVGSEEYKKFNLSELKLRNKAIELFGRDNAYKLIANISTRVAVTNKSTTPIYPPGSGACDCSRQSDWCGDANPHGCVREGCAVGSGCGTFWSYTCNGDCF